MAGLRLTLRGSIPKSHMAFNSYGLVKPGDKLKTYLHCHSVYGQQTWLDGDRQ